MRCLGDFARRLWGRWDFRGIGSILAEKGRGIRGIWGRMIGLEPEHVLAGAHRGAMALGRTCRGKRAKIRSKKLRFQQPWIGFISAFFHWGALFNQPKCVKPGRRSTRNESVATSRVFRRGRQARYRPKRTRKRFELKRPFRHSSWEIQPSFSCLRRLHSLLSLI